MKNLSRMVFLLTFFWVGWAVAGPSLESGRFADVEKTALELGKKIGNPAVLLVFDVDSTLLAMKHDLGSDNWYYWQESLLKTPEQEPEQAFSSYPEFADLTEKLLKCSDMRPSDPKAPSILRRLQRAHFPVMALTSRAPELAPFTDRELKRNGYDFRRSSPKADLQSPWLPVPGSKDLALTPDDLVGFSLKDPRPVSYENGVFFGNGQHKGAMLRILLNTLKRDHDYRAVIFVDDLEKHTKRMLEAFDRFPEIDVTTVHYTGETEARRAFQESDKTRAVEDLRTFRSNGKLKGSKYCR